MTHSQKPTTPRQLMEAIHEGLRDDPSRTDGIDAVFAFVVDGESGGSWWIEARDGSGAVHEGSPAESSVTVQLNDDVLVRLGNHELDGGEAFVNGLLTVTGDQSKAILLGQIFGE